MKELAVLIRFHHNYRNVILYQQTSQCSCYFNFASPWRLDISKAWFFLSGLLFRLSPWLSTSYFLCLSPKVISPSSLIESTCHYGSWAISRIWDATTRAIQPLDDTILSSAKLTRERTAESSYKNFKKIAKKNLIVICIYVWIRAGLHWSPSSGFCSQLSKGIFVEQTKAQGVT